MKNITIDIECAPMKINNEKIWIYLSEKATTRSMNPVFSKIISIAIKESEKDPEVFFSSNEYELLSGFWDKIAAINPDMIITFNGYGFDIPFLYVRSLVSKVKPSMNINTNKWNMENSNHYDCMMALSHKGAFLNVALDIICNIFSIEVKDKIDGREIESCYLKGDWDSINTRCKQDVIQTEELYKKLKG